MKNQTYIRCPRCELNFILKRDKFCNVCKMEMKAQGSMGISDDLDLELCPVCKVNFVNPDEDMCVSCAKEKTLEDGLSHDAETNDWEEEGFNNEDGGYSEDEERGEMVSITDLEDSPLDTDDDLGLDFAEEEIEEAKLEDEEEEIEDLDDDVFDDLDEDDEDDEEDDL